MPTSSVQGMPSPQFTALLGTGHASRPEPTPLTKPSHSPPEVSCTHGPGGLRGVLSTRRTEEASARDAPMRRIPSV